jgi:PKD repeat protein
MAKTKLMKTIILFFFILIGFQSSAQDYSRLKVFVNDFQLAKLGSLGVAVDHGIRKEGQFFISDFSAAERHIMDQHDFDYEVLIEDVQAYYVEQLNQPASHQEAALRNSSCISTGSGGNTGMNPTTPSHFNLGTMGGYLKYTEMLAELDEMVATYPNLITAKAPISTFVTYENRPIYYVRISDNPGQDEAGEPKILYSAIHHAREPMSLMETIFFMWYVLENYGTNDEVTYLVNNTQLFFVPCLNPDGYVYNQTTNPNGGGMWRKNRRLNSGGSYGVDLNRNYSYGWGTTGTTTTQTNETYCGTAPFSEPETQAMRWLVQQNDFEMAFNAHTYAQDILFPIGTTVAEYADHHAWLQAHTNRMVEQNGYVSMKSSGLYPASGDSDDYMYKVDVGVGQKDTIFSHTPEIGTAFWQPSAEIIPTCKEMVFPNLVLAHLSRNYTIVKDTDPSNVSTISGNFTHSAYRLGRMSGPVTVSIQPLLNIASVGAPVVYNLTQMQLLSGSISYTLVPGIQTGAQIKYILQTDNGLWVDKDTIIKTFGAYTLQASENGTAATNWTGNWSTTTSSFVSSPRSFTDTPTGNYVNNANTTYTYTPSIDLTNANAAKISYWAKWDIETDYDFAQFQVSVDNGTTWIGQCGNYTVSGNNANGSVQPLNQPVYEGTMSNWVLEEINLSDYLGQVIKVRFQLKSDGGTRQDGFYFDDFSIYYNIAGPAVIPVSQFQMNGTTSCVGSTNAFFDVSQNAPTSWFWDFGDGSTSIDPEPFHTYTSAGNFTVSLTVTNAAGSSTSSQTLTVSDLPVVTLQIADADLVVCQQDQPITLTASPQAAMLSGVGVVGSTFDPSLPVLGPNAIYATYYDSATGCVGTASITVIVDNCAGISDLSMLDLQLFPNPSTGSISIAGINKETQIVIYDMNGKLLQQHITQTDIHLDLPYRSGIYVVEVKQNEKIARSKVTLLN